MNTSHFGRTTLATSAVAATLTLLTAVGAPTASAQIPAPRDLDVPSAATPTRAADDIGVIVALRKEAVARYRVQHAGEIIRAQALNRRAAEMTGLEDAAQPASGTGVPRCGASQ